MNKWMKMDGEFHKATPAPIPYPEPYARVRRTVAASVGGTRHRPDWSLSQCKSWC